MSYTLDIYNSCGIFSIGPTQERVITVELEPGYWDIAVIAYYGTDMAALAKKPQVEIRAGRANSVSFTMDAEEFITPDRDGWGNQDMSMGPADPPRSLSITLKTSTIFSAIPGWTDNFSYRWYSEDGNGIRDYDSSVSFSGPLATVNFSCTVDPGTIGTGTFGYYAEVTNNFTYLSPEDGTTTTGTATKNIYVANVRVGSNTLSYLIGDTGPGGGIIFYRDPAGFYSNGVLCYYLEVGPASGPYPWSSNIDPIGATDANIGTGWTNTQIIISALSGKDTNSAAHIARAYNGGGLSDWFLPSQLELLELYNSGYFGPDMLWASTEGGDTTMACRRRGTDGNLQPVTKTASTLTYVRPVRAF
jgi:hypothetical protein